MFSAKISLSDTLCFIQLTPPCSGRDVEAQAPTYTTDRKCVTARKFNLLFQLDYESKAGTVAQRAALAASVRVQLLTGGVEAGDLIGSFLVRRGSVVVVVAVRDTPDSLTRMRAALEAGVAIAVDGRSLQASTSSGGGGGSNVAVIAGVVVGAVFLLAVLVVAWRRRMSHRQGASIADGKRDGSSVAFENPLYDSNVSGPTGSLEEENEAFDGEEGQTRVDRSDKPATCRLPTFGCRAHPLFPSF